MGYYLTDKGEYKDEAIEQLELDIAMGEANFDMVSESIRQIFTLHHKHDQELIKDNMIFLKSKFVELYCSESRLDQETLIRKYYKKLSEYEKQCL